MPITRLCGFDDVQEGQPMQVVVQGRDPFAVYKVGSAVYVTDDFCTHGKASLSDEGEQDGFTILCTWHDGSFDIRTGETLSRPCTEPLKTYEASVKDGDVFIDLD